MEAVAEVFRRVLRDVETEYENSESQVVLTRDIQRLSILGQVFENLRSGSTLKVQRWVGRRLEEAGVAEPGERVLEQRNILQLEWRERNNPGELQPIPQYLYLRVREEASGQDGLLEVVKDIYSLRLRKLLSLASKRVSPNMIENLTREEEALYQAILAIIDEWMRFIAPGGEGR